MSFLKRFLKDERGTETVEWAIIIGIIAVGVIAIVVSIGQWVFNKFSTLNSGLQQAT